MRKTSSLPISNGLRGEYTVICCVGIASRALTVPLGLEVHRGGRIFAPMKLPRLRRSRSSHSQTLCSRLCGIRELMPHRRRSRVLGAGARYGTGTCPNEGGGSRVDIRVKKGLKASTACTVVVLAITASRESVDGVSRVCRACFAVSGWRDA